MSGSILGYREDDRFVSYEDGVQIDDDPSSSYGVRTLFEAGRRAFGAVADSMHSDALTQRVREAADRTDSDVLRWIRAQAEENIEIPRDTDHLMRRAFVGSWRPYNWIAAALCALLVLVFLYMYFTKIARFVRARRIIAFRNSATKKKKMY